MKTKWTLLLIAGLGVMRPVAARAQAPDLQRLVVHDLTGNMHIHQPTPIGCPDLTGDVSVTGGRLEISPAEGRPVAGGRLFVLTQGLVSIHPFTAHVSCLGEDETKAYTALDVQLARATSFVASPGPASFNFSIPASDVLLYEAATVNGGPENGYKHPRDPVTGTIDLAAGTFKMTVVVATKLDAGVLGDFAGSLATTLSGTIAFPDTDADGVADRADNCKLVANADQGPVGSPLVRAPVDVTLLSCADRRIGPATAADICDGGPVTVSNDAPSPYPPGSTIVTWSAKDSKGRVRTDTQTVTIDDKTPPVFTSIPGDILLLDCGPAELGLPTAIDDCGGSPTLTNDAPAKFLVGPTAVNWTATDLSGNHATATQTVTVRDLVPPDVSCGPGTNPSGQGHGGGGFFRVFASDHCDVPTIRLGDYVLAIGETIKITETGQSGVTLVNVMGPEQIRHFHVHHDEAVITATDASGNVARTTCQ